MPEADKIIFNNRGLVGQILSVAIMIASLVGVGAALSQNARYRTIASAKTQSAKSATQQLEALLNLPFTATELGTASYGGVHCSVPLDPAPACAASPITWTVSFADSPTNQLLKIQVATKLHKAGDPEYLNSLGAQNVTGYKYNDF